VAAIPIQNGVQQTADQFTKCLYHVYSQTNAHHIISDAFEQGALVQGIGLISIFNDMRNDPISGDIRLRYIDFKSVVIDPFFRYHDLSDCRFIWTRQYFDKEEAQKLFPQIAEKIEEVPSFGFRDDKFYYMPEVYQIQYPNMVAIDEYWYLAEREALYIVDTLTEETQEFLGDEEDLRVVMQQFGGRLDIVKKNKQTVRRQIIVNDRTVIDEPNPYGTDRYPFVVSLGYFTPNTPYYQYKFRGIVRDMRDAQYLFNRRKVADLDILEAQQQGLIIKKGSLVTPDDALNRGHGRVLVRDEDTSPEDIQPMDIRPPSPIMLQMEEMLMETTHRIAGVDPKAMGIEVDDKAGIISMMRQAASARNLQRLFDQLDQTQKQVSEIMIEMIQKNWTFGKIKQVIGEEPTPEFDNKLFFKYSVKIVQAPLTESQQQLELAQLLEYQKMYPQLDLSQRVLEAMNVQNKDEIKQELLQQAQQQQEQQQQRNQLEMQQMQVDNEMKLSYAASEKGKYIERTAKAKTEQAESLERLRRSQEEETSSVLNLVKSLKELEEIDIRQIKDKIELLKNIRTVGTEQEEKTAENLEQRQETVEQNEVNL
jgi:hypothetical protein